MFELEVPSPAVTAGATIQGHLTGLGGPAEVALLRVESCPGGRLERAISSTVVAPQDGQARFELAVPPQTPTGFAGPRCELGFAVRAHSRLSRRRSERVVVPVEVLGGDSRVHEDNHLYDRVIASFPGRHFHLEMADALLEGSGRIEGRIHAHDQLARTLEVVARCDEVWRTNFRLRNRRHPPLWRNTTIWQDTITVFCDADRRWHPFAFAIPAELPPAVEGYIACWRYEIEARHRSRVGLTERAVITPIRFDVGEPPG
jgi:hypothetical protein